MLYFKNGLGHVFAYNSVEERLEFGGDDLVPMTDEEVRAHTHPPEKPMTLDEAHQKRRKAYVTESDPIKNEADYDALVTGTEPDYTAWMAAVEAIKARYPLPEL